MFQPKKIVFFGVGAIGASVGTWIAEIFDETYFFARGKTKAALKANGIAYYEVGKKGKEDSITTVQPVKIMENLGELTTDDVLVLTVKNYNLSEAAEQISDQCYDEPLIISMANGKTNQDILPKYFSKVIYCIVCHNAWRDIKYLERENKLVVGSQKRGPIILGTPDNTLQNEMNVIKEIFDRGIETIITDKLQDTVHSKIALNLVNALTALLGHGLQPISDPDIFQTLTNGLLIEGIKILEAEGYNESQLGGLASWSAIRMSAKLPRFMTRGMFKKAIAKMPMSSMTQDIVQRKLKISELESLNGYILKLGEKHNIKAPYNRTLYNLCKARFKAEDFRPMDVKDVMMEVQKSA
ncbi:MAG: ketopantoate reductase family protein [Candidatus Hodarchaeota archaeon]